MYTFIIKDKQGHWFKSKLGFITKKEAEDVVFILTKYEFIETIKVVDEDDEELFDLLNLIQDEQEEGMISALIDYRLGDFLSSRQYDIWWSVKKADIDESFLQIKNIMMKVLLPELKKLEDEEFAKKFIRNIELSYELG